MTDSHPQSEAETAIDESRKFWRDMTLRLLGWGTAFTLLVAGYTIKDHESFELGILWSEACDQDDILRAAGLLAFASLFAFGLPCVIHMIYKRRLTDPRHPAIIPSRIAFGYALILGVLTLGLAILVSIF